MCGCGCLCSHCICACGTQERERGDDDVVDVLAKNNTVVVNEEKVKVRDLSGLGLRGLRGRRGCGRDRVPGRMRIATAPFTWEFTVRLDEL